MFNIFKKKVEESQFEKIVSKIQNNIDLSEKISKLCSINLLIEQKSLVEYNANYHCESSLEGTVFAEDGFDGAYILFNDDSIGYINYTENECGRVAKSLKELLELELNCAYSWHNYGMKFKDLNEDLVFEYESRGRKQFNETHSGNYDEIRDEIAKVMGLNVPTDILKDILNNLYNIAKIEPLFTTKNTKEHIIFENIVWWFYIKFNHT